MKKTFHTGRAALGALLEVSLALVPALLLLTLAYAFDRDKRLLASLTVTTCTKQGIALDII